MRVCVEILDSGVGNTVQKPEAVLITINFPDVTLLYESALTARDLYQDEHYR